ncbi:hypothetical protein E2C01_025950 [Portunus trituberculatus]|uniref:Uncharacterized protein n=1 Tax=Portunus trituberculatus TaxID=210409 RepID=A0A5B7EGU5_PORTR|nr:hypothetical protein [Portunus trituberculatus]
MLRDLGRGSGEQEKAAAAIPESPSHTIISGVTAGEADVLGGRESEIIHVREVPSARKICASAWDVIAVVRYCHSSVVRDSGHAGGTRMVVFRGLSAFKKHLDSPRCEGTYCSINSPRVPNCSSCLNQPHGALVVIVFMEASHKLPIGLHHV